MWIAKDNTGLFISEYKPIRYNDFDDFEISSGYYFYIPTKFIDDLNIKLSIYSEPIEIELKIK